MHFLCPHCRQPMEAEDDRAGKAMICPACLRALSVPRLPAGPPAPPARPAPVVQPSHESPKALRLSDLPREIPVPPAPMADRHRKVPTPPPVWRLAVLWLIAGILAQAGITLGTGPSSALKELVHRTPLYYAGVLLASLLVVGIISLALGFAIAAAMKREEKPFRVVLLRVFCIAAPALGALLLLSGVVWHEHGYPWLQGAEKDDVLAGRPPVTGWVPDPAQPGHFKPVGPPAVPTAAEKVADLKRLSDFNHVFIADMEEAQKEYTDALAKAGVRRIMDPSRIEQDKDSSETQVLLAASRTALQNLRTRVGHLIEEHPARLEALHLAPANLKSALDEMHDTDAGFVPILNESWDAEAALMDRVGKMIQFLQERRADWSVGERGRFKFKNDEDGKRYAELVADAQKITARQAALREQLKGMAKGGPKKAPAPTAP